MRSHIEDILNALWARRSFQKLNWMEFEELSVEIMRSDMSDYEKVKASKELLDAFTRRGHFDPKDYLTKPIT